MKNLSCLSDVELWKLIDDEPAGEWIESHEHLSICETCRARALSIQEDLGFLDDRASTSSLAEFEKAIDEAWEHTNQLLGSTLETSEPMLEAGDRIDRYEICDCLNSGGQGEVYLAFDRRLKRQVAIKVSRDSLGSGMDAQQWGKDEGELLARVNHPRLAQVYDTGVHDGHPFLVMEYVEGWTLVGELRRRSVNSIWIRDTLKQVCSAVEAIHTGGILHLDLKPENVMVTPQGNCKLIDLGTAWFVSRQSGATQSVAGTPEYVAPEQLDGAFEDFNVQTDVFGVGAILYFLLTGSPIRSLSASLYGNHRRALEESIRKLQRAGQNKRLTAICVKAIAPEPRDRYQSVTELQEDLSYRQKPSGLAMMFFLAGALSLVGGVLTFSSFLSAAQISQSTMSEETAPTQSIDERRSIVHNFKPVRLDLSFISDHPEEVKLFVHHSHSQSLNTLPMHVVETENAPVYRIRTGSDGIELNPESGVVTFMVFQSNETEESLRCRIRAAFQNLNSIELTEFQKFTLLGADEESPLVSPMASEFSEAISVALARAGTRIRGFSVAPWVESAASPRLNVTLAMDRHFESRDVRIVKTRSQL
ncbi:serine/threonine-protein kinase [Thalassoglobus sp. JC818]|uniref:serine/threonine protein kinase n=1 Tax=Thalassoglobus sp. JC818 TaxID=3232136 RepID=UPI0034574FF4